MVRTAHPTRLNAQKGLSCLPPSPLTPSPCPLSSALQADDVIEDPFGYLLFSERRELLHPVLPVYYRHLVEFAVQAPRGVRRDEVEVLLLELLPGVVLEVLGL